MRFYVAVVAIAVAGCGSGSDSQSPSASATATSAAQTPHVSRPAASTPVPATPSAIALAPNCRNGLPPPQIVQAQHADDGVPDPAGRIVFGRLTRVDDGLGQLVSINAIDPDGSDLTQVLDCETERPRLLPRRHQARVLDRDERRHVPGRDERGRRERPAA